jgi:hypothetical protein
VKSKGLKPVFHCIGSRVETRRFQADGSTGFSLYSPTLAAGGLPVVVAVFVAALVSLVSRGVAGKKVNPFEGGKTLKKPGNHVSVSEVHGLELCAPSSATGQMTGFNSCAGALAVMAPEPVSMYTLSDPCCRRYKLNLKAKA